MTPSRDLHLTERRPRLCRLPPGEVDFLRARHAAALDLAPNAARHVWRVTPAGVAGVLVTPWRRVVISPKLPISNLLFLLDPHACAPDTDRGAPADGSAVLDLLAALLAERLDERLAAGLHRGYREREQQGPYLLGRLDLPAQLRQAPGRRDLLHCRHDELTADLPCHQLPRAVAALLAASPLIGEATRVRLARAVAAMPGVSDVPVEAVLDQPVVPPGYSALIGLCQLLARDRAPAPGAAPCPSLLVSLERLFEQYVTRAAVEAFGEGEVTPQDTTVFGATDAQPGLTIRPDVVVRRGGEVLVLDAKWKRLPAHALIAADVYQALSYGALLAAGRAVLVYPGRRRPHEYTFAQTPLRLEVRCLDVAGPPERCLRARSAFMRRLRRHFAGAGSATRP